MYLQLFLKPTERLDQLALRIGDVSQLVIDSGQSLTSLLHFFGKSLAYFQSFLEVILSLGQISQCLGGIAQVGVCSG